MENKTMMQFFEWYLPENGLHWSRCSAQAKALKEAGINMIWLPPAYKGAGGKASVGYDVYDTYDLGEFDQKGTAHIRIRAWRFCLQMKRLALRKCRWDSALPEYGFSTP